MKISILGLLLHFLLFSRQVPSFLNRFFRERVEKTFVTRYSITSHSAGGNSP